MSRHRFACCLLIISAAGCRTRLLEPNEAVDGAPSFDLGPAACAIAGAACNDLDPCTENDHCQSGRCAGTPIHPSGGGCAPFSPGWDVFDAPFDRSGSFATWHLAPGPHDLILHLHLTGLVPRAAHVAGLHLFNPALKCLGHFGPASDHGACLFGYTREHITVPIIEAFDLGSLPTDDTGTADVEFPLTNVAPGTWPVEFHVRVGDYGQTIAGHPCPDCDTEYQSPGPFGRTVLLVIPE